MSLCRARGVKILSQTFNVIVFTNHTQTYTARTSMSPLFDFDYTQVEPLTIIHGRSSTMLQDLPSSDFYFF